MDGRIYTGTDPVCCFMCFLWSSHVSFVSPQMFLIWQQVSLRPCPRPHQQPNFLMPAKMWNVKMRASAWWLGGKPLAGVCSSWGIGTYAWPLTFNSLDYLLILLPKIMSADNAPQKIFCVHIHLILMSQVVFFSFVLPVIKLLYFTKSKKVISALHIVHRPTWTLALATKETHFAQPLLEKAFQKCKQPHKGRQKLSLMGAFLGFFLSVNYLHL